jgi:carboxymethylenebutenolidase
MTNHAFNTVSVPDGSSMDVYTAFPDGTGPLPAIIVLQEAFGVNSHIRNTSERLCSEGYAVVAPDLFHRTAKRVEIAYADFAANMSHFQAITTEGLEADLTACADWLKTQGQVKAGRLGAIGFCLGGRVAFLANIILPLQAAVSYYGGRTEQYADRADRLQGPHLFFWGGLDKHITTDQINMVMDAVKNAGKAYTDVRISYADHGFNCDERSSYNPEAAAEAWAHTLAFLANRLKDNRRK